MSRRGTDKTNTQDSFAGSSSQPLGSSSQATVAVETLEEEPPSSQPREEADIPSQVGGSQAFSAELLSEDHLLARGQVQLSGEPAWARTPAGREDVLSALNVGLVQVRNESVDIGIRLARLAGVTGFEAENTRRQLVEADAVLQRKVDEDLSLVSRYKSCFGQPE
ncbi:hypothetical protein BGX20_001760 [Mortierella sp. AD010]|nr:hypothetical protein BGX20_001760 [Mortierella sp. AD010]